MHPQALEVTSWTCVFAAEAQWLGHHMRTLAQTLPLAVTEQTP